MCIGSRAAPEAVLQLLTAAVANSYGPYVVTGTCCCAVCIFPSLSTRRASLRECEADEEMARLVPDILGADPMAAALLIECRGRDASALQASIDEVNSALLRHKLPFGAKADTPRPLDTYQFSHDTKVGGQSGDWLY